MENIKQAVDVQLPTKEDLQRTEGLSVPNYGGPAMDIRPAGDVTGVDAKQQGGAPLFIKLDRYNKILTSLFEVRKSLENLKNVFSYVSELERMKSDSFKMLHDVVAKMDQKLDYLDSEFLRPPGFESQSTTPQMTMESTSLENIVFISSSNFL